QARQQRAQPQDRRPEPRQQRQVRPHRERHQHHHGEEEQYPDQRPAADTKRNPDIPANEGGEGAQWAPSMISAANPAHPALPPPLWGKARERGNPGEGASGAEATSNRSPVSPALGSRARTVWHPPP